MSFLISTIVTGAKANAAMRPHCREKSKCAPTKTSRVKGSRTTAIWSKADIAIAPRRGGLVNAPNSGMV